jgi:hypothetical protein
VDSLQASIVSLPPGQARLRRRMVLISESGLMSVLPRGRRLCACHPFAAGRDDCFEVFVRDAAYSAAYCAQ